MFVYFYFSKSKRIFRTVVCHIYNFEQIFWTTWYRKMHIVLFDTAIVFSTKNKSLIAKNQAKNCWFITLFNNYASVLILCLKICTKIYDKSPTWWVDPNTTGTKFSSNSSMVTALYSRKRSCELFAVRVKTSFFSVDIYFRSNRFNINKKMKTYFTVVTCLN